MVLVEAVFGAYPYSARRILKNGQYQVAAYAARVVDIVCERFERV